MDGDRTKEADRCRSRPLQIRGHGVIEFVWDAVATGCTSARDAGAQRRAEDERPGSRQFLSAPRSRGSFTGVRRRRRQSVLGQYRLARNPETLREGECPFGIELAGRGCGGFSGDGQGTTEQPRLSGGGPGGRRDHDDA